MNLIAQTTLSMDVETIYAVNWRLLAIVPLVLAIMGGVAVIILARKQ